MNLLDLMQAGEDLRDKALDRLESIVAQYSSSDDDVQDEALARAISLCGKEWGSYKAGLEELVRRREAHSSSTDDPLAIEMEVLRLREEAEDPGALIRMARARRQLGGQENTERAMIVARYGSFEAAVSLTPVETMFVSAACHLADSDPLAVDGEGIAEADGPWATLAGWSVPWHEIPAALALVVTDVCPLPTSVADARAEALSWEERKREREILADGPGKAVLPTACAARHRMVEDAWRRDLPVRDAAEFEARLDYWASRGGDDGTGYGVLLLDWRRLGGMALPSSGERTKEKARRLRAEHPDWSLARIGKELGISRQAVHKHLKL
ncbi:HTH domain-containing protein [Magnetospirillum aberrantis]|uniref:Helix-turn-helix domain-containing protein n=1 Tax=Magnetospirillum aberrantis SpK TaxID=908842 RepID=A0A7C9UVP0_9PROT|nr:HTH domain-containing protein [Magnetospirillum aberrantis]NFV79830.1 helix-turn-helix domain-containing protein [Magnetospirillum aberrantis SpK]